MAIYHRFDEPMIEAALSTAQAHHEMAETSGRRPSKKQKPLRVRVDCLELDCEDEDIRFLLPCDFGSLSLPLPESFAPNGKIRAYLDLYCLAGNPVGARIALDGGGRKMVRHIYTEGS